MKKNRNDSGFTLVEVLVAMLVFTVGIIALAQLMAVTMQMQAHGRNQTSAVRLAQDKLDQLMSLNFDTSAEVQITGENSLDENIDNYFDTDIQGYTRRWLIEAGPDGNADLRQITIRVIPDVQDRRTATPFELMSIIRRW
ncbi:MAG: prepilin-type N-terminal cleavage/methylation domain-containing protein [Vicinamibacterales bacterium]|nr:prepilin-type N-terminal cleavage/methylation domain-containing protein [Vicinamibacterales bacterium]